MWKSSSTDLNSKNRHKKLPQMQTNILLIQYSTIELFKIHPTVFNVHVIHFDFDIDSIHSMNEFLLHLLCEQVTNANESVAVISIGICGPMRPHPYRHTHVFTRAKFISDDHINRLVVPFIVHCLSIPDW